MLGIGRSSAPSSEMIVDAHCHILPPTFADRRAELSAIDATFAELLAAPSARIADAEALLQVMDRDGIDHAVVMGMGWSSYEVAVEANDYLIGAVNDNPDRITGFASLNPVWGDAAISEVQRCAAAGLRGMGELHPDTQGFDIADRATMVSLMDVARSLNLPTLIHCSEPVGHHYPGKGNTTPDKVWTFIRNFPENTVICAHWGGGLPFYALMPEVAEDISNVYFDSAASPFLYRSDIYLTVAGLVGPDRILFASDYPLMPPSRPLEEVAESKFTDCQRGLVLGGNAVRLLGL